MSPETGNLLVDEVVSRLRAAVSSVPTVGHGDREELLADMTATAAAMIDSAERAGKTFTAGNIAFYASRAARSGRRSTGAKRTDVMSPGAKIDGVVRHDRLDADLPDPLVHEADGSHTLHDIVWTAGGCPDPSEEAGRNLDWQAFIAGRPPGQRTAILVLARGGAIREAGRLCGIGDTAAWVMKKRLAEAIREFFGSEVIAHLLAGVRPAWEPDMRASRERHACHAPAARHDPLAA